MYIFSSDDTAIVNSDNVKTFSILEGFLTEKGNEQIEGTAIVADGFVIGEFECVDDAKRELLEIFRMIEIGAKSYQITRKIMKGS